MANRFQFGLRNLLAATFWLCLAGVTFSGLRALINFQRWHHQDAAAYVGAISPLLVIILFWLPFVAVGALFGATKKGMLIGFIAAPILLFLIIVVTLPRVHSGPRALPRPAVRLSMPATQRDANLST